MDIGTAKPDVDLLRRAPHRLIDLIEPWESYSAARFHQDALREMAAIRAQSRIPLLVGGTMLYFRVLRDGIAQLPEADANVRAEIAELAQRHGWPYIHALLAEVDPESARRIRPSDPQRLQRALEVYRMTGRTMTEHWGGQAGDETGKGDNPVYTKPCTGLPPAPWRFLFLGIAPSDRSLLHQRIAQRFDRMLELGLVEEVRALYQSGRLDPGLPSMRCVGYRQVWDFLDGRLDYRSLRERGVIATRQLAKRQLTWMRSWPDLHWLDSGDEKLVAKALKLIDDAAIE
jgi:tRNA dimethylallyltransferase